MLPPDPAFRIPIEAEATPESVSSAEIDDFRILRIPCWIESDLGGWCRSGPRPRPESRECRRHFGIPSFRVAGRSSAQ